MKWVVEQYASVCAVKTRILIRGHRVKAVRVLMSSFWTLAAIT